MLSDFGSLNSDGVLLKIINVEPYIYSTRVVRESGV
jgi:hypothetical protein